jgi:hypothetical protein
MIREMTIRDGWIVQDNNLLACNRPHIEAVFDMLRTQRKGAVFSGGLDVRLLKPWHRKLIDSISLHELWVACDSKSRLHELEKTAEILDGIAQRKRRCYLMIGYGDETLSQAEERLERVFKLGFDPFSQLYRGERQREYDKDWKALNRKWSRPAAYHAAT